MKNNTVNFDLRSIYIRFTLDGSDSPIVKEVMDSEVFNLSQFLVGDGLPEDVRSVYEPRLADAQRARSAISKQLDSQTAAVPRFFLNLRKADAIPLLRAIGSAWDAWDDDLEDAASPEEAERYKARVDTCKKIWDQYPVLSHIAAFC